MSFKRKLNVLNNFFLTVFIVDNSAALSKCHRLTVAVIRGCAVDPRESSVKSKG